MWEHEKGAIMTGLTNHIPLTLRAKLIDAIAEYMGWEESAIAMVDEVIMPVIESEYPHE